MAQEKRVRCPDCSMIHIVSVTGARKQITHTGQDPTIWLACDCQSCGKTFELTNELGDTRTRKPR